MLFGIVKSEVLFAMAAFVVMKNGYSAGPFRFGGKR